MALIRGMDGALTYATISLGNCRVIGTSATRGQIPGTVKGDKHAVVKGGVVDRVVSFSGYLDYVTGQQDVIDFLETATPDITEGALVFTLATGKTWTYSAALFLGYSITSPEGDAHVTFECSFHPNVPAVIAYA